MNSRLSRACLLLALALLSWTAPAFTQSVPRVHFIATGGTISAREGARLTAEELAKSMPGVDRYARLTHEQFANVASTAITLEQWLQLSRKINDLFTTDKEL